MRDEVVVGLGEELAAVRRGLDVQNDERAAWPEEGGEEARHALERGEVVERRGALAVEKVGTGIMRRTDRGWQEVKAAYHDDVELGTVKLARLALELNGDRLHRLRGQPKFPSRAGVVAVNGDLADVHPDDFLRVLDKLFRDQPYEAQSFLVS